ncbi:MAG: NTP transferase domain-containing protein [Hungatella sp.]|nr:NTP transferase domain-containing protein [Hungatella sp.]
MDCNYIIVQAGGKGTRMEALTRNKPKALVPVDNLPIIMHLFRKYPDKKFIVIGDYKYDVLKKYLREFAQADYKMVCGSGKKGTCAGMREAVTLVPDKERFMIIWCDLVLAKDHEIPESEHNIIGISKDFPCRWKYENGKFTEERSTEFGVAGYFIFTDKSYLSDMPEEGEFVKWIQSKRYLFEVQGLYRAHEYGLYSEWDKLPKSRCRPFNKIRIENNKIYKEPIDDQGKQLAMREIAWYKKLKNVQFENIPQIYEYEPLCMEKVDGKNIYEYKDISNDKKKDILEQIINCLKRLHDLECIPADRNSYKVSYLDKTYERLKKVRALVPFANDKTVMINERVCRNIFYHQEELEKAVMGYFPSKFKLIHGDCTFSNIMLKQDSIPILIDPRGYFGTTEIFGDTAYDWIKLYYSMFSNYDQFNLKNFNLYINEHDVKLEIASNNWECMEEEFFKLLEGEVTKRQMKLLLSIIWLSLTTYAWEDYDSICGAFYNGLYYLEEAL